VFARTGLIMEAIEAGRPSDSGIEGRDRDFGALMQHDRQFRLTTINRK
jgi:hypothetical protein